MSDFYGFKDAINNARNALLAGKIMHRGQWQGVDVSKHPEMATLETTDWFARVPMWTEQLEAYQIVIKPNLPWADDHFLERVCGEPINPGVEWANWPWGHNAAKFLDENGQFNHNYMQRYWPKYAGMTPGGKVDTETIERFKLNARQGIRHPYGDLEDIVRLLANDPDTRQATFLVYHPEDQNYIPGERKPCSISHVFRMDGEYFNHSYHLRSCDYLRHFRDDLYLTVRLHLWMLHRLREENSKVWDHIRPGKMTVLINNLHVFRNDIPRVEAES